MAERKIPVIYQQRRKLVNVNLASFDEVVSVICKRLKITDDIHLFGKRSENEGYFDIEDDDDLEGLDAVEGLVLLVKNLSLDDGDSSRRQATGRTSPAQDFLEEIDASVGFQRSSSPSVADEAGGPPYSPLDVPRRMPYQGYPIPSGAGMPYAVPVYEKPPEYAESTDGQGSLGAQSAERIQVSQANRPEAKVTVIYGEKTKKIAVERSNFEAIRNLVANRFELSCDFQLKVKDESGHMIDIDSDGDAADNMELMHTVWVIPTDATTAKVVKPAVTEDMSLVKVGRDEYSITETPEYKSVIVKKASAALQKDVCISSISAKLDEVEECLRIAYYATVDNKELRCKTQNMQFEIQKLCAECDTTMLKIKLKTADILNELQCGFGYLLDGFEDFGLERLGCVGPIAEEIQEDAASLKTLLSRQEAAVKGNLAQVEKHGDERAIAAKKAVQHAEQQRRRALFEEKRKEVCHSESQIERLAERERSAVETGRQHLKSDSGIGFGFKKLITFGFYQGNKPRAEQEERFAGEMREEQARQRERLAKLKEETIRAEVEFEKFLVSLNVQPKEMSKVAIQGAEDGLKTLGAFLQSLADFWEKNGAEFNSINNTAFLNQLRRESDPERREGFWKSKSFKVEAMKYIARFVAIQKMCEDFHETMTKVLDDIHQCIRDNPTADEAKAKLPRLVEQFKAGNKARREREYAEEEDPDIEELS